MLDGQATYFELWVRPDLARALGELGRLDEARAQIVRCDEIVGAGQAWRGRADLVAAADAAVLAHEGLGADAERRFAAARDVLARHALHLDEAELLHEWGRMLDAPVPRGALAAAAAFLTRAIVRSSPDYVRVALRALRPMCDLEPIRRPGGGGAQDAAPRITRASLPRTRFAVGRPHGRRGTQVRFSLSEPSTVSLTIHRRRSGRLERKGALRRIGVAGPNRVALSGRVHGRKLVPGRYRLTLVARDARGQRSTPVRLGFRIVRP